jgi:hypothetical protein
MTKVLLEVELISFSERCARDPKPSGQAGLLLDSSSTVIMKPCN